MWIFTNNAFVSIIAHHKNPDLLIVRARYSGDIERLFPNSKPIEDAGSDYRYRSVITRKAAAEAISQQVRDIEYNDFKESVDEPWRHDLYVRIWNEAYSTQARQGYNPMARRM